MPLFIYMYIKIQSFSNQDLWLSCHQVEWSCFQNRTHRVFFSVADVPCTSIGYGLFNCVLRFTKIEITSIPATKINQTLFVCDFYIIFLLHHSFSFSNKSNTCIRNMLYFYDLMYPEESCLITLKTISRKSYYICAFIEEKIFWVVSEL